MRQTNVHQYFVYILTNAPRKTVLYTGVTNSLERRLYEHKHGLIAGFTKQFNCNALVYFEIYQDIRQAITREKQIKSWTRAKKEALIGTTNPEWKDLSTEW
jgi:putative endonuclease